MHKSPPQFPFLISIAIAIAIAATIAPSRAHASFLDWFLPGKTGHGHHQIDSQCSLCHEPFGGVSADKCVACHSEKKREEKPGAVMAGFGPTPDYKASASLQPNDCVGCHHAHRFDEAPDGVTAPKDFCYRCHPQLATAVKSHKTYAFDSCLSAGCHTFHDSGVLEHAPYERLILKKPDGFLPRRRSDPATIKGHAPTPEAAWKASRHGSSDVACTSCHEDSRGSNALDKCQSCHEEAHAGFIKGRHGMRVGAGLPPLQVDQARLPMATMASGKSLTCVSCHDAHASDTRWAAVEACLGCHVDEHSLGYKKSAHYDAWLQELAGAKPSGTGVSCASCHMPRNQDGVPDHNQNANLRPRVQMVSGVCIACHDLKQSLSALQDAALVKSNFRGSPSRPAPVLNHTKDH